MNTTSDHYKLLASLKAEAETYLGEFQPKFDFSLGQCGGYEQLLAGSCDSTIDSKELYNIAQQSGRVLISARGGAGKTTLLKRVLVDVIESDNVALILELKTWSPADTEGFDKVEASPIAYFDHLVRRFSNNRIDLSTLDSLPASQNKLVIIDGLNETPGKTANKILTVADEIASLFPGLSIIASDRLVRRNFKGVNKWNLLTILPIEQNVVVKFLGRKLSDNEPYELVSSPFFLHRAISDELKATPDATVLDSMMKHSSLTEKQIEDLSRSAFKIYLCNKSRLFHQSQIESEMSSALISGGQLVKLGDDALSFIHHSIHDILASVYVADNEELWAPEHRHSTFDAITFSGSSFDAIASVLRILSERKETKKISSFLQAVYDWNPYASGYALVEAEATGTTNLVKGMRAIVLFMLGLRMFDHQISTKEKARDALSMFKDGLAKEIFNATSIESLVELAGNQKFDDTEFREWFEIFSLEASEIDKSSVIDLICDDSSIKSWTLANVLKFNGGVEALESELVEASHHKTFVVRWRVVHALGSAENASAVDTLFERIIPDNESERYVRYGAIRSLIEIALRQPDLRESIFDRLLDLLPRIRDDRYVLNELMNAIFIDPDLKPENWSETVTPILHRLIDLSESVKEIDNWTGLLARLYDSDKEHAA